ncbi:MAG TPA: CPBP family intramembrane glutamic endopeptidase [Fimbriimonadaceae bacterium]|nr:CPBP family intramembrane glutamic endopeptidase [Fimbriimonadaceae bacterium]
MKRILVGKGGIRAGWSVLLFFGFGSLLLVPLLWLAGLLVGHRIRGGTGTMLLAPSFLGESALALSIAGATCLMARIERRKPWAYWLDDRHGLKKLGVGALMGLISLALLVAMLFFGHFIVFDRMLLHGPSMFLNGAAWLGMFFVLGFCEEALFRGYVHFTLTRGTSFIWSSVITSVSFGLAHLTNSNEGPVGLAAVLLAGLAFCWVLRFTGSIYFAIGFHTTWDWAQSFLIGVPNSGQLSEGRLFLTHPQGSELWSGGSTGPLGSVLIIPIMVLTAAACWRIYRPTPGRLGPKGKT